MTFKINIEKATEKNKMYRKVVHTDKRIQVVLMCLVPGEFIPRETHKHISQFFRVEEGRGAALVGSKKFLLKEGDSLVVPPNMSHKIIQTGRTPLKMYTIYSPPNHPSTRRDERQPEHDD